MAIAGMSAINPRITQLIFCSRAAAPQDRNRVKQDIDDIVQHAQVKNPMMEVTGALLTDKASFAQVLEGPVASIDDMYSEIIEDKRHHSVELLQYVTTHVRLLPLWALALVEVDHIPDIGGINGRSTPLDRRKACISVLAALRPLLLG